MEIHLKKELTSVLEDLNWLPLKPVQSETIPRILAGDSLLVQAETGAGKTAAYLLAILEQCRPFKDAGYALIIAPTRELALQIRENADLLSSRLSIHTALLIGGVDPDVQEAELKRYPQIIIGTPGRVLYMLENNRLDLSSLKILIADEADLIFATGQMQEFQKILDYIHPSVQTVCFSATISDTVRSFIKAPYQELILDQTAVSQRITSFYLITDDPFASLLRILKEQPVENAVVFVNHRSDTEELAAKLKKHGYLAEAFSAYQDEKTRLRMIRRFKTGTIRILTATDAAARGLDIRHLTHSIHYDLPADSDTLIHRSGRSGHQGQTGTSILLIREEETSLPLMREIRQTARPLLEGSGNPYDLTVPMEKEAEPAADVITLRINAGKDDKLRPKDIAGAFSQLLPFEKIGRIVIRDHDSTVILLEPIDLQEITIKGKKRKIRQL